MRLTQTLLDEGLSLSVTADDRIGRNGVRCFARPNVHISNCLQPLTLVTAGHQQKVVGSNDDEDISTIWKLFDRPEIILEDK